MTPGPDDLRGRTSTERLSGQAPAGLALLLQAYDRARQLRVSAWDYAVALRDLHTAGLSDAELRLLVRIGCLEQAITMPRRAGKRLPFRLGERGRATERSCFVLTEAGADLARHTLLPQLNNPPKGRRSRQRALKPHWEAEARKLWVGGQLVKRFRMRAANQEMILAAFQEQGWPSWTDDPLPHAPGIDPKVRLHDTIKALNRHQKPYLIHFKGDGTGTRVGWELRPPGSPEAPPAARLTPPGR